MAENFHVGIKGFV